MQSKFWYPFLQGSEEEEEGDGEGTEDSQEASEAEKVLKEVSGKSDQEIIE